jgi:integrase
MVNAAEWSEMNLNSAVWTIQADKMKMRREFRVPLSAPALAVIQEQTAISGGHRYVFGGRDRSRPLSGNTMRQALRSMGFDDHVPHGWRAAFSSICNEYGHRPDAIELCLAHEQRDKVRAAYNRSQLWDERRALMEWWANFLTGED